MAEVRDTEPNFGFVRDFEKAGFRIAPRTCVASARLVRNDGLNQLLRARFSGPKGGERDTE